MTYALREARPRAPCPLAAQMTRVIALMALVALGLSGTPFHEPFHGGALCGLILLLCVHA